MNIFANKFGTRNAVLIISVLALALVVYTLFRNIGIRADVANQGASLQVIVNDELGVPLNGAKVSITSDQTNQTTVLTAKSSDGSYRATVGPGTFTVQAESPGYISDSQPTSVEQDQEQQLNFYLKKQ